MISELRRDMFVSVRCAALFVIKIVKIMRGSLSFHRVLYIKQDLVLRYYDLVVFISEKSLRLTRLYVGIPGAWREGSHRGSGNEEKTADWKMAHAFDSLQK